MAPGFEDRRERFISIVQNIVRAIFILVAVGALALADSDFATTQSAKDLLWGCINIGITVAIAYVLYELVMSVLERYMPEEETLAGAPDGEIGGSGATRQETLAPLLRGTFIVLLAVLVALSVLNIIGAEILPLLAGASIAGLALGFGAQKLVQDVISGVFFLIDDAFRRGEYIDVGEVKGTVEKFPFAHCNYATIGAHCTPFPLEKYAISQTTLAIGP